MPNALSGGGKGQKGKGAAAGKGGGGGGGGRPGGGSQPSQSSSGQQGDWPCHICGTRANRDWRERCRSCNAYRSLDMERALAAHAQRTQQQRRGGQQQQPQQQPLQRQQQQRQQERDDADRRQLRQRVESLQAELAAVKATQTARPADADDDANGDDMEDDSGFASWSEEERAKRLDLARGGLAYAAAAYGEDSPQASELREEISALQRASREAKPFKAHRNQLERRRDELRRKQDRDEAAVAAAQSEIKELEGKVATLQSAIEDRAKLLKQVVEELNEIVRKSLAEDCDDDEADGKPEAAQASASWAALATAASGLSGQPGLPAEVGALLAQLQQVAGAVISNISSAQSATTTTPPANPKQKPSSPCAPPVLAPHGRFAKAAAKPTSPSPPRPPPATPTATAAAAATAAATAAGTAAAPAAAATAGVGGTTPSDGDATGSGNLNGAGQAAPTGAASSAGVATGSEDSAIAAGATPTATAREESEPELIDDRHEDDDSMVVDLESSLALLPEAHRKKLRAAIRAGGGRGRPQMEPATNDSRRDERERSPRPTKLNDGEV